ncbi:MAG: hypothetical protein AB8B65_17790 [Kordia sp.]
MMSLHFASQTPYKDIEELRFSPKPFSHTILDELNVMKTNKAFR